MGFYQGDCQFCGEEVGPPSHVAFFAFADLTFYPGGNPDGVRITKPRGVSEGCIVEEPVPDVSVHQACWRAYWDGIMAGRRFYRQEPEHES